MWGDASWLRMVILSRFWFPGSMNIPVSTLFVSYLRTPGPVPFGTYICWDQSFYRTCRFFRTLHIHLSALFVSYHHFILWEKKKEIWLSPMTKAPTPTEMSKGQSDNTHNATSYFVKIIWCSHRFCKPPPFIWGCVLLYLWSPKGRCCSILDDLF